MVADARNAKDLTTETLPANHNSILTVVDKVVDITEKVTRCFLPIAKSQAHGDYALTPTKQLRRPSSSSSTMGLISIC